MSASKVEQPERILSTMNRDGSRAWMRPCVSSGRFLTARRWVGYLLIVVFVLIPHIKIGGKPAILLDLGSREFTFFGFTLLPTDTLVLAIFLVGMGISVFFITALLGRVWCGWGCPQLVYMEFVFRPIEYWLEGRPGFGGRANPRRTAARTAIKYVLYFLICLVLAHTFVTYFVGVETLWDWILHGTPVQHLLTFFAVMLTTGLMMFDFCFFREQTCIVACPYGRIQSVMLDRDSLIISYDPQRGEPRGRLKRNPRPEDPPRGDCVDCRMCVETCPTGIDIRGGLQLECIGCAQCIDACDAVMGKIKKPRGLIRYSSQNGIDGTGGSLIRPRIIVYPAILLVLASAFIFTLASKQSADIELLRGLGRPFNMRADGAIISPLRLKITNRGDAAAEYTVGLASDIAAELRFDEQPIPVPPGESRTIGMLVITDRNVYTDGKCDVEFSITDGADFETTVSHRLLGPYGPAAPASTGDGE